MRTYVMALGFVLAVLGSWNVFAAETRQRGLKPVDPKNNACTTKLSNVVRSFEGHDVDQRIQAEYESWEKNKNNTNNKSYNQWEEACHADKALMKKACEIVLASAGDLYKSNVVKLCEMSGYKQ